MNIYDIADAAGVSPTTVSRVLNGKENVKESTRQKVLAVIEGKAYKPNPVARNLSTGASKNVAFLVPDIDNNFFMRLLHGISEFAYKNQYNVFMYGTDENVQREHQILESLQKEMVCGVIVTPVSSIDLKSRKLLLQLEERGIPVVLVDRDIQGTKLDGIFSNDIEGACEAVTCMIEAGHRRIGMITGPETSKPGANRVAGYKKALMEAGLPICEDYMVNGFFREEESYHAMERLMSLPEPPTAIFASNNLSTLGCLKYLNEKHLRVGKDISLIGFDEIKELSFTHLQLTTVDRPIYEMGYEAMTILSNRLKEMEEDPNYIHRARRYSMDTWLVKRGSEKLDKI